MVLDDNVILKGISKGKEIYLEKLMDNYIPYVTKIVGMIGGSYIGKQDAEEIISDVFLAVWENRKKLRITDDIKPYLAQIARNKSKNKLRQLSNSEQNMKEQIEEVKEEVIFTNEMISNEIISNIQGMVNEFPFPEKDILYGYYFYEWKLKEIALTLQLPLSTVKTKLYRSREKLKQAVIEGGYYE